MTCLPRARRFAAPQGRDGLWNCLEAARRIGLDTTANEFLPFRRELVEWGVPSCLEAFSRTDVRQLAGQHLVDDDSEGVHVGGLRRRLPAKELGRHVGGGAGQ